MKRNTRRSLIQSNQFRPRLLARLSSVRGPNNAGPGKSKLPMGERVFNVLTISYCYCMYHIYLTVLCMNFGGAVRAAAFFPQNDDLPFCVGTIYVVPGVRRVTRLFK